MLNTQLKPRTWNESASTSVDKIWEQIPGLNADIQIIRTSFEFLSTSYFDDDTAKNKESVIELWITLGAYAITWGKIQSIDISKTKLLETLVRKQRDYGHHNIAKYGRKGIIIRVHDKIARLENLTGQQLEAANEPIEDTILDIAGYSAIGIMWETGTFLLPLE